MSKAGELKRCGKCGRDMLLYWVCFNKECNHMSGHACKETALQERIEFVEESRKGTMGRLADYTKEYEVLQEQLKQAEGLLRHIEAEAIEEDWVIYNEDGDEFRVDMLIKALLKENRRGNI